MGESGQGGGFPRAPDMTAWPALTPVPYNSLGSGPSLSGTKFPKEALFRRGTRHVGLRRSWITPSRAPQVSVPPKVSGGNGPPGHWCLSPQDCKVEASSLITGAQGNRPVPATLPPCLQTGKRGPSPPQNFLGWFVGSAVSFVVFALLC